MGLALRATLAAAALVLAALTPTAAHAQTTSSLPPLEDVTLRGRVLHPDGAPVANTPVRVDAINDSGFAILGFFFSAGFTTLTCFTADKELCPLPNSKRFASTTDGAGNYSFTFHNAHRRGVQTDTDYVLSIGVASHVGGDAIVVGSYELELKDAMHTAPDLTLWDPTVTLTPGARDYRVAYPSRPSSKNGIAVLFGDKAAPGVTLSDRGGIDARSVEDQSFTVVAHASKDVTAAGTIYHQRFSAAPVTRKGTLVPLSRNAACNATRADGTAAHCGYTDGDLVTPGVVETSEQPSPVTQVTIDLGAAKTVGEVREQCACRLEASTDAQTWHGIPNGTFGGQRLRYVRVSGASLAAIPEISVWPPWPDDGQAIGLLPGARGGGSGGRGVSSLWVLIALGALCLAGWALARRRNASEVGETL